MPPSSHVSPQQPSRLDKASHALCVAKNSSCIDLCGASPQPRPQRHPDLSRPKNSLKIHPLSIQLTAECVQGAPRRECG